jgi:hypothetical protein
MSEKMYNIYFEAHGDIIFDWKEYWCDIDDPAAEKEMIEDIKYALREAGGGEALIYDEEGELMERLNVCPRPTAIYKIGDKVSFVLEDKTYLGTIGIVDAFGTFFDNSEPYYDIDIEIDGTPIFVKHVPQNCIRRVND